MWSSLFKRLESAATKAHIFIFYPTGSSKLPPRCCLGWIQKAGGGDAKPGASRGGRSGAAARAQGSTTGMLTCKLKAKWCFSPLLVASRIMFSFLFVAVLSAQPNGSTWSCTGAEGDGERQSEERAESAQTWTTAHQDRGESGRFLTERCQIIKQD